MEKKKETKTNEDERVESVWDADQTEYPFDTVEKRQQRRWQKTEAFKVENDAENPAYTLEMFPYPSGKIHMGHVRNYAIGDAIAHYQRKQGKDVLHPMGWDAFGLPAENAARKRGIDPAQWTEDNINDMKEQLDALGLSYDWSREVKTCDSQYYKFNQWLFVKLYEDDLAYRDTTEVHFCPSCKTVLADEQVEGGQCWRCDGPVVKKDQPSWFFKITEYADELLEGIDRLDGWPDSVREMQRNWIGKSTGANISFSVPELDEELSVYTTRPDTLYGVTYTAVAPDHPIVEQIIEQSDRGDKIKQFIDNQENRGEDTTAGVDTGFGAINPINDQAVPIYVADYVISDYGSGSVMAVPAHDERDYTFAQEHDIGVKRVVENTEQDDSLPYEDDGVLVNSRGFNGQPTKDARDKITKRLEENKNGSPRTTYQLRNWNVSRQRGWGTPIPVVHCDDCGPVPVPEDDLPVKLPEDMDFDVAGNPLAQADEFVETDCPECGSDAKRETDTLDGFVGSSWYYLRYASPDNKDAAFDKEAADNFMPVDHYIGGVEHAVMHLLYARFINRYLSDKGEVKNKEPFENQITQGMVLKDGEKMSKSKGNVVSPRDMMEKYGADVVRTFTLFAAPKDQDFNWDEESIRGQVRFLNRFWNLATTLNAVLDTLPADYDLPESAPEKKEKAYRKLNEAIKQARESFEELKFNTAISAVHEGFGAIKSAWENGNIDRELAGYTLHELTHILTPIAPHICNEIACKFGFGDEIFGGVWPEVDDAALKRDSVEYAVQVNGKIAAHTTIATGLDEEAIKDRILDDGELMGKLDVDPDAVKRTIVVQGNLVNIVV